EKTPFYINTEARPWVHDAETPRRAGVNAFGFGGIDAHVVLEEYRPPAAPRPSHRPDTHRPAWDSELCVIEAPTQALLLQKALGLQQAVQKLASRAADDPSVRLEDVAYSLAAALDKDGAAANLRLATVATSLADLQAKLERACKRLADPDCRQIRALSGIYFAAEPLARQGKLAFLFPGEGSQYVNMLADLCLHFPPVRECFDATDRLHRSQGLPQVPSDYVFPRPNSSPAEAESAARALWEMDGAVASVLTADEALGSILAGLGVQPDAVVGHSSGEIAALQAAGVFGLSDESRADVGQRLMQVNSDDIPAAHLLAIGADCAQVEELIAAAGVDARVAMDNCPHQVVVALEPSAAAVLRQAAGARGLIVEKLSFERPYHTPLFGPYSQRLQAALETLQIDPAHVPVYSCATAAPCGEDPEAVKQLMAEQWLRPVEFRRTVEALYEDGVRLFVEVGPRGNLTSFVEDILRRKPICAVASNLQHRSGVSQVNHLAGLLAAQGVPVDLTYLYRWRNPRGIDLDAADLGTPHPATSEQPLRTGVTMLQLPPEFVGRAQTAAALQQREIPREEIALPQQAASAPFSPDGLSHASHAPTASPAATPAPVEAAPSLAAATHAFLETMEQFLAVQESVMRRFL
ncbi:MAG: acyltransferase domain-containing protein, partial [Acidobacteria bacterium]|nr:acyltransferase domain-containing protein [Acidobacteriota bacterium]